MAGIASRQMNISLGVHGAKEFSGSTTDFAGGVGRWAGARGSEDLKEAESRGRK